MPQTREHLRVLRALGLDRGVVAVTKTDVAPIPDLAEIGRWPVVPVSSRTGAGIEELRAALDALAAGVAPRPAEGAPLLHVDRVFSVVGAGTVVTGTLWAGTVAEGDRVRVQPSGAEARVRSVEVHDARVASAAAGQRVALNLVGLRTDEIHRGDVIGDVAPAHRLDVALDERVEGRVTVHHGTRETPARVAWLGGRFHQLRCEQPLMARRGDRLVIRSIAPPDTIGGGEVIDPAARRHGPSRKVTALLERLARGEEPEAAEPPPAAAEATRPAPLDDAALALEARLRAAGVEAPAFAEVAGPELDALRAHGRAERAGPVVFHRETLDAVRQRVCELVEADGSITLARLRDELRTSRRYAQALLEHLDAARVTRRLPDDSRVLRARR